MKTSKNLLADLDIGSHSNAAAQPRLEAAASAEAVSRRLQPVVRPPHSFPVSLANGSWHLFSFSRITN